ncbi:hypothetical protein DIPPA_12198 [Diplonema papillatum]|nr:hypothetical protein DIPPA_12198 [Diplonema papillatum]KAJ9454120.1 hypothetical protein DIPPA_12198 [Diplonema papillatum]
MRREREWFPNDGDAARMLSRQGWVRSEGAYQKLEVLKASGWELGPVAHTAALKAATQAADFTGGKRVMASMIRSNVSVDDTLADTLLHTLAATPGVEPFELLAFVSRLRGEGLSVGLDALCIALLKCTARSGSGDAGEVWRQFAEAAPRVQQIRACCVARLETCATLAEARCVVAAMKAAGLSCTVFPVLRGLLTAAVTEATRHHERATDEPRRFERPTEAPDSPVDQAHCDENPKSATQCHERAPNEKTYGFERPTEGSRTSMDETQCDGPSQRRESPGGERYGHEPVTDDSSLDEAHCDEHPKGATQYRESPGGEKHRHEHTTDENHSIKACHSSVDDEHSKGATQCCESPGGGRHRHEHTTDENHSIKACHSSVDDEHSKGATQCRESPGGGRHRHEHATDESRPIKACHSSVDDEHPKGATQCRESPGGERHRERPAVHAVHDATPGCAEADEASSIARGVVAVLRSFRKLSLTPGQRQELFILLSRLPRGFALVKSLWPLLARDGAPPLSCHVALIRSAAFDRQQRALEVALLAFDAAVALGHRTSRTLWVAIINCAALHGSHQRARSLAREGLRRGILKDA